MADQTANANVGKISRNAPCPCGSGKKYKLCCGAKAVAEEREVAERESPFWTPKGVTVERDDAIPAGMCGTPKWRMALEIIEENAPEDDADNVIQKLVRPFFDRYCDLHCLDDEGDFDIVVLESFSDVDYPPDSSPAVMAGRYSQLWDMLKDKVAECLANYCIGSCTCEVRRDSMFGGPIVTVFDGDEMTVFHIARPDRFDPNDRYSSGVCEEEIDDPEDAEEIP